MHAHTVSAGLLLTAFLFLPTSLPAETQVNEPCMKCHGVKESVASSGARIYIDPAKFAATTHSIVGCRSCHDKVSPRHPTDRIPPSRATCGDCHAPVSKEYAASFHGSKARCNDCHNPHEVRLPAFMSGEDINNKCSKCHEIRKTIKSHTKWLPQADLHIDSMPCITCHTGSKDYVITMFIESRKKGSRDDFKIATYEELAALTGKEDISRLLDLNGDHAVSLDELRQFNHHLRSKNMRLLGMMTPEVVTHSYQILDNRWDCTFCHASGPKAMQKSFISLPEKNGGFARMNVEKGAVLDILYGTPDFYMLGTTRSTALSIIGALIIAAGLSMPIGHGFFRFLTRKNREETRHDS